MFGCIDSFIWVLGLRLTVCFVVLFMFGLIWTNWLMGFSCFNFSLSGEFLNQFGLGVLCNFHLMCLFLNSNIYIYIYICLFLCSVICLIMVGLLILGWLIRTMATELLEIQPSELKFTCKWSWIYLPFSNILIIFNGALSSNIKEQG